MLLWRLLLARWSSSKFLRGRPFSIPWRPRSVGLVGGVPLLDLAYEEDSRADVDMIVVLTGSGKFVELQATAEHATFEEGNLAELIKLARIGITELQQLQQEVLSGRA